MKKCPKCGYERLASDDERTPATECPACGVIYGKAQVAPPREQKDRIDRFASLAGIPDKGSNAAFGIIMVLGLGALLLYARSHSLAWDAHDHEIDIKLSLYLAFFGGLGTWWFFRGMRQWRRERLIETTPTSKIRSMAMGLVELQGQAEQGTHLLKGPFSNKDCVFYKYRIERLQSGDGRNGWVTVASASTAHNSFFINDGTGRALVDPEGADVELEIPSFEFTGGGMSGETLPVELENYLLEHNIKFRALLGTHQMRFKEWDIRPGDTVFILGTASNGANFAQERTTRLNAALDKLKHNSEEMKKLDTDGDGKVGAEEWEQAVNRVKQQLLEDQVKGAQVQPERNLVIKKGDKGAKYIIAKESRNSLCDNLNLGALSGVLGGALVASACFFLLGRIAMMSFFK